MHRGQVSGVRSQESGAREGGEAIKANKIATSMGSVPRIQDSGVRGQESVRSSWSSELELENGG